MKRKLQIPKINMNKYTHTKKKKKKGREIRQKVVMALQLGTPSFIRIDIPNYFTMTTSDRCNIQKKKISKSN